MTDARSPRPARGGRTVHALVVEVGRKPGDGLPEGATGAALLCYAPARDEAEAVRETVALLRAADMAPLDVTGYGTARERAEAGHLPDDEAELMQRAADEDAVVVVQVTVFRD